MFSLEDITFSITSEKSINIRLEGEEGLKNNIFGDATVFLISTLLLNSCCATLTKSNASPKSMLAFCFSLSDYLFG